MKGKKLIGQCEKMMGRVVAETWEAGMAAASFVSLFLPTQAASKVRFGRAAGISDRDGRHLDANRDLSDTRSQSELAPYC